MPEVTRPTTGLRHRLRAETAEWHVHVEAVTDIPGTVQTRDDYVDLLLRWYELHAGFEERLTAKVFDTAWRAVGLDLVAHRRAYLLEGDINTLGGATSHRAARSVSLPPLVSFGHAVGCLYVLEGSSLGGPTVAGLIRERIGEVPITFLLGENRPVRAWPAVLGGLRRFAAQGGEGDDVVAGACDTFAAFAAQLSRNPRTPGSTTRWAPPLDPQGRES